MGSGVHHGPFPAPRGLCCLPSKVLDTDIMDGDGNRIEAVDLQLSGDVYWDGSCDRSSIKCFSRAAWALVALKNDSNDIAVKVSGLVPQPYLQTPQAAEFMEVCCWG